MGSVLVVDDSGTMRKIIIRTLNSIGVQNIAEAADGSQALELFNKSSFDLVLSDWNMPVMTGFELLVAIRSSGSKVPVMLITTESEKSRVLEAVRAGVNDYLVKPFDAEGLRSKIERFIAIPA
jgi:two-component system chemotaxis response regulator CheY